MVLIIGVGHDGGVLVDADLGQALQVAQLQRRGWAIMMMGGIPERGGQGRSLSVDDLRPLLSLGLGLAGRGARFMRGLRDLGDRVADVLDRHDRFHRGGHPEVGDADTQTRNCQEDGSIPFSVCAVRRCWSEWRRETFACGLSQQAAVAEGSLIRVVAGRAGAALTKPGRASTARWRGSGERGGKEYARNRRFTSFIWDTGSNLVDMGRAQRAPLPFGGGGNFREVYESRTGRPRGKPAAYSWQCCRDTARLLIR